PKGRAHVRAHSLEGRFAEREPARGVANQWCENVASAQRLADGDAQRLLSAAKKYPALDFARPIQAGKLVIQHAREQHPQEPLDVLRAKGRIRGSDIPTKDGLKHGLRLSGFDRWVQPFLSRVSARVSAPPLYDRRRTLLVGAPVLAINRKSLVG